MRMSAVDEVGGQQPLAHTHDMEMWLRLAAFSDVAYLRGCDQAWHRDHDESLSAKKVDAVVDLRERRLAFDMLFSGIARHTPKARELHLSADRALDRQSIAAARRAADLGPVSIEHLDEYLAQVRSSSATTRARVDAVRRSAGRAMGPAQSVGAAWRRLTHKVHYERSFRTWHRRGEF